MKKQLREQIAQGKTEQALQQLLSLSEQSGYEDLRDEILLQSANFKRYSKTERQGTSAWEQQQISIARINSVLLEIIDQLPIENSLKAGRKTPPESTSSKSSLWWKWIVGAGVIIGILAGIAEMSGYNLKELFGGTNVDSFSITVFVHGKEGKDDRILKDQGKVVLDIGTARQEASINEKGEATFKELPIGYVGQAALISIDHDQPYLPRNRDSEYVLVKGEAIYLEVELKGIDKIQGRVLDFETEKPLDSVRVSYQNIPAYTDEFGWYQLNIPPDKQDKFVRLNFFKEGYQMENVDSIAPHTQQEVSLFLKKE